MGIVRFGFVALIGACVAGAGAIAYLANETERAIADHRPRIQKLAFSAPSVA